MIADLRPYAEYKDSGVPWVGNVPAHWEIRPNRGLFAEVVDRGHGKEQLLSVTISRGIIKQQTLLQGSSKRDSSRADRSGYKLVHPGDLAYNKMRAWQGAIGVSSLRGIVSPAYVVFRPRPNTIKPDFCHFLYRTLMFAGEAQSRSYGIASDMWSFRPEDFRAVNSPFPPPDEQAAIVRFLDWATRRVDRAIRAKRRLVALLTEQKQAIIHRAVTQGLDPSVPMKESGIPWLGEIPAHWEVRRLSAVARFRNGKAHEQFIDPAGAYVCVNARFVSTDGHKRKLCTRNLTPAHIGDVLMVMSDLPNGRALARAFLVRDDGHYAVNQRVCALTPHKIDPRLLAYSSNRNWHLLRQNDGFNQTHLSNYDFKTMPILLPPPDEQIQIAEWIDHRVRAMDAQLGGLASQIELLREYRARLVADVVTGKLDVRAFAETLPDEAPDDIEATEADVDEDADDDETGDGADEG